MDFLVFAVEDLPAVFFRNEEREVVFVDVLLLVKIVVPDKTGVLPVLRYGLLTQYLPVFVGGVQIKQENASRIQIVVHQTEHFQKIFFFCDIVHAVTDGDNCPHSAVKLEFAHVLQKVEDVLAVLRFFLHGDLQHVRGVVNGYHVVAGR